MAILQLLERMGVAVTVHGFRSTFRDWAAERTGFSHEVCEMALAHYEVFLKLALRAQSQCRATLEILALIKHPQPVAIVKQANIAAGPQQVNNVQPAAPQSETRTIENDRQTTFSTPMLQSTNSCE